MYASLTYILDNPIEGIIFETFSAIGQNGVDEVELKKGGKSIEVKIRESHQF